MKICIDGRPIRDPITGVASYVLNILNSFKSSKIQLDVFIQSNNYKNKYLNIVDDFNAIYSHNNSFIENILTEFRVIPKDLRSHSFDIVHETYFSNLPLNSDYKISTIHDVIPIDFPEFYNFKNRFFSKRNFHRQVKESDLIITVSEYSKKRILEISNSNKKIEVVPLCISDIVFKNMNTHKSDKENPFYLVIGNIEPRKNLITAAKAVKLFNHQSKQQTKLISVGREIYKSKELLLEVKELLGNNFEYKGFVSEEEKVQLIKTCEGLIMPSSYEGFGIPIIEGEIIGCPVYIAKNSSMTELAICEEQLFETYDFRSLANNIFNESKAIKNSYHNHDFNKFFKKNQKDLYTRIYKGLLD